jgi:hypothetical protein
MPKTEVYSWRVSPETKTALEIEARREATTLAVLLDRMTQDWLRTRRPSLGADEEQQRLHAAAARTFGSIAGGEPRRAERARTLVRQRLVKRYGRRRLD